MHGNVEPSAGKDSGGRYGSGLRLRIEDVRNVLGLCKELRGMALDPAALQHCLLVGVCRLVGAASGSALVTQIEAGGKRHRVLMAASTPAAPPRPGKADLELLERCLDVARYRLRKHRTLVAAGNDASRAAHGEPSRTAPAGVRRLHHYLVSKPLPTGGLLVNGLLLRRDFKHNRPFSARDHLLVEFVHSQVSRVDLAGPALPRGYITDVTRRQFQILQALLNGQSEKQIAHQMGLSGNTVHHHVKSIYRHFIVSSRGELLAYLVHTALGH